MSTPPDQPSASPYQNPQQPGPGGGAPASPPTGGGYGTPVPPQHNPYAQPSPSPSPSPSPYAPSPPPTQAGGYPGYYAPGAPGAPQPAAGGGAGRAVLWGVVGAVVASALWGGGVLLLNKDSDSAKADLRGYTMKSDLCTAADLSAFEREYPQKDTDPTTFSAPGTSLDSMSCSEGLKKTGSSYSDAYLSLQMDLHKKSDPGPEFADGWLGYRKRSTDYIVTAVDGIGDEAYLVTQDTVTPSSTGSSSSGDREVILGVREGWMTYSMSWSAYASSLDTSPVATVSEATDWVKTATRATLAKLKP